jgi:hypothetical protein
LLPAVVVRRSSSKSSRRGKNGQDSVEDTKRSTLLSEPFDDVKKDFFTLITNPKVEYQQNEAVIKRLYGQFLHSKWLRDKKQSVDV